MSHKISFQPLLILFHICFIALFINIHSHNFFYNSDSEKPSLSIALLAAVLRHVWGVAMSGVMLGVIYRYGWFAATIMNNSTFHVIGKISYATFICHLFVVKLMMTSATQPIYLSDISIVS